MIIVNGDCDDPPANWTCLDFPGRGCATCDPERPTSCETCADPTHIRIIDRCQAPPAGWTCLSEPGQKCATCAAPPNQYDW